MSNKRLEIVASILNFIKNEIDACDYDQDSKESLEVASQCIEKVYNISTNDCANAADLFRLINKPMVPVDSEKAEKLKIQGNDFMTSNQPQKALESYTEAILYDPTNHIYYGNRSAAYLKLEKYSLAIEDSLEAVYLNPKYHKGYGRIGIAYIALDDYEKALPYLEEAVKLDPTDKVYQEKLSFCKSKLPSTEGAGGFDFGQIMNNPEFMNMAKNLMQSPDMQRIFGGLVENLATAPGMENGSINPSNIAHACESMVNNLSQNDKEALNKLKDTFKGNQPPPSN